METYVHSKMKGEARFL